MAQAGAGSIDRGTILLVEDDADSRLIYGAILRHHGFEVLEARDGRACVEMAQSQHPDLILMDVALPLLDGWAATRELKSSPQTSQIPVVALTVLTSATDRQTAIDVGCEGYLAKPAQPHEVLAEVRRVLARRQA